MGFYSYKILIKYQSITPQIHDEIKKYVESHTIVAWAALTEGTYDLIITIVPKSRREFNEFHKDFFNKFGNHFQSKEVLIPQENFVFNEKYLYEGKLSYQQKFSFINEKIPIDKKDTEILTQISLNSRASFSEIGRKVNLTGWAVKKRYEKLNNFIIGLKARINFKKLGFDYHHLFIEVSNDIDLQKIISYYTQQKDCVMIMTHVGKYSAHLEFVTKNFREVLDELRANLGTLLKKYEPIKIIEEYVMKVVR